MSYRRNKVRRKYFRYCYFILNVIAFTQILCRRFFLSPNENVANRGGVFIGSSSLSFFLLPSALKGTELISIVNSEGLLLVLWCASRFGRVGINPVCPYAVSTSSI